MAPFWVEQNIDSANKTIYACDDGIFAIFDTVATFSFLAYRPVFGIVFNELKSGISIY